VSHMLKLDNFRAEELVSPAVWSLLGDKSLLLFDEPFLIDVDRFVSDLKRDTNCSAVVVNNWFWQGHFTQSGFREHTSSVGSKRSQHRLGKAVDLKFKGGVGVRTAYSYLIEHQERYPMIKRVEDLDFTPTWLHVDAKKVKGVDRIYLFTP